MDAISETQNHTDTHQDSTGSQTATAVVPPAEPTAAPAVKKRAPRRATARGGVVTTTAPKAEPVEASAPAEPKAAPAAEPHTAESHTAPAAEQASPTAGQPASDAAPRQGQIGVREPAGARARRAKNNGAAGAPETKLATDHAAHAEAGVDLA
ncbi:MAG TPA: hypothetical protein VLZ78_01820, partial [Terrimesophilobacter sp.]|nr:hypothetical protein [Terrimesophilobacter sp.]